MQLRFTFCTLLLSLFVSSIHAQNTSPYWSLAGNSGTTATASSKLGTTTSIPLNLVTNNATRVHISTDGKLGIGTTSPQQRLHVEAPSLLNLFVSTTALSATSGSGMIGYTKHLPTAAGQRLGYFLFGSRGGAEQNLHGAGMVGYAQGAWSSTSWPAYLAFETTPEGAATRVERVRIDKDGNVGIGTTAPHPSSLLEMTSTTKGVLFPRMTASQKSAIASPAQGLLIYQIDGVRGFYYYDRGWQPVIPPVPDFANNTLSNLSAPTAINQHLLPNSTNARDLGSSSLAFRNLYLRGEVYLDGTRFVSNAPGTGAFNAFVGSHAGLAVTSGTHNTAVGQEALRTITTGYSNTVTGAYALYNNSSGFSNIAIGTRAMYNNVTGMENIAIGDSALFHNEANGYIYDEGIQNTAVGMKALYRNTTGALNTAVGFEALYNNTTGFTNTAVGFRALYNNTNPNGTNVGIGINAGYNSSSSSVFIGFNAYSAPGVFNAIGIGTNAYVDASNKVRIGNSAITSIGGQVNWTAFSDGRYKQNIKEDVQGLDFINALHPITYTVDVRGLNVYYDKARKQPQGITQNEKLSTEQSKADEEASKIVYSGFVAQEVEKAARKLKYEFSGVDKPKTEDGLYGLRYSDFVVPLVKAVQELSKENEELKRKVADVDELRARVQKLEALLLNNNSMSTNISSAYLEQNAPNPSRGTTAIRYHVPESATSARLTLTNSKGQLLKTISITGRGTGQLNLETTGLAAGTYHYTLWVDGKEAATRQLVVTR